MKQGNNDERQKPLGSIVPREECQDPHAVLDALARTEGREAFDLDEALERIKGRTSCLILTHNNPDPDSIASAEGLRILLEACTDMNLTIGYAGVIGRAENRAMVKVLSIKMLPVYEAILDQYDCFALVDSQPGAGNNILPDDHPVDIVIDHHPRRQWEQPVAWVDVREHVGATSSMVYSYLVQKGIEISPRLSTALLYGIISDTMDLGRGASEAEHMAYLSLLPHCDLTSLMGIRWPKLPVRYYRILAQAIEEVVVHCGELASLVLGDIPYPDLPAELADFFIRAEGIKSSFCSGHYKGQLYLSLRTERKDVKAGDLIKQLVGSQGSAGGHEQMAGGTMKLQGEPRDVGESMRFELARLLGLDAERERMIE